ncbi:MAG: glycosyltransferase involved in cell wall biosynthesis [Candidatus Latescibacterota bacterium]|jgi:glycosyltransferase involved in cell wall biosynthesis
MPPIVHITTVHSPFDNRIFHRECKTLAEAGYEVVLVAAHTRDEKVDGIQIRTYQRPPQRIARMTLGVWRALKTALRQRGQIYHFHDPEFIPAALLMRLLGKKLIYDIHEDNSTALLEREYLPRPLRAALARIFSTLERIATRPFQQVLAERYYAERFPRGHTVLNYARLPSVGDKELATRSTSGPARLLYTGNIKEFRGALHHTRILHAVDDAEVFLIGRCDPQLAADLKQLSGTAVDRLHIEGIGHYVAHERIIEFYLRERWTAGLAIFPAGRHTQRKELTKIFEYMAYGLPIICSNFPSLSRIVAENNCGLCVDPADEQAIADAVRYLSQNPDEAQHMGQNGLRAAREHYHWGTQAVNLIELYQQLT